MAQFRRRALKTVFAAMLVVPLTGFAALESLFAPGADLWGRWQANNPASTTKVDHGAWGAFLKKYVSTDAASVNRAAYGKVTDADKHALHDYLSAMRKVLVDGLNRDEQMAYWINLYNALTIRLVIDFYPVKSIQDIDLSSGLFGSGPWDKKLIKIPGEMISLNDIEHRILRPIWEDPRIHYAVNCASVGCPNLAKVPYAARTLDDMLRKQAKDYINSPRGVKITEDGIVLSKIYTWFKQDFGGSEAMVLDHLATHASSDTEVKIMQAVDIDGYDYDWTLNDAP